MSGPSTFLSVRRWGTPSGYSDWAIAFGKNRQARERLITPGSVFSILAEISLAAFARTPGPSKET